MPTDNPTCTFVFTGRRFDPETEIYFYRARYYHAELGRFMSREPLGSAVVLRPYQYCGCSPTIRVDSTGLRFKTALGDAKLTILGQMGSVTIISMRYERSVTCTSAGYPEMVKTFEPKIGITKMNEDLVDAADAGLDSLTPFGRNKAHLVWDRGYAEACKEWEIGELEEFIPVGGAGAGALGGLLLGLCAAATGFVGFAVGYGGKKVVEGFDWVYRWEFQMTWEVSCEKKEPNDPDSNDPDYCQDTSSGNSDSSSGSNDDWKVSIKALGYKTTKLDRDRRGICVRPEYWQGSI